MKTLADDGWRLVRQGDTTVEEVLSVTTAKEVARSTKNESLDGVATDEDLARLERWSVVLRGRGACGTLDGATNVAASLLRQFPQLVAQHLTNGCETCRTAAFDALRPYEVEAAQS